MYTFFCFYSPAASAWLGLRVFELSVRPSEDQVKIFGQGRISRPINGSKLIFHMRMYLCETNKNIQEPWPVFHGPLTSDFSQIIKVKIFGQGRISRPINGTCSKLYFIWGCISMRPAGIYKSHELLTYISRSTDFRTLARLSRLTFLSKVESQDLLMVASWYFIWGCMSLRPAGIYKSHDLMTYISRSTDFGLWPDYQGKKFVQGRISRPINGSKLIFHMRM